MDERFLHRATFLARRVFEAVFGLRVTGSENIPPHGAILLACNHISDWDPPVLGCGLNRTVHFMAKKELFRGRLMSYFFSHLNAFPLDRRGIDRQAVRTCLDLLARGCAVAVFPEGTRSTDGRQLQPRPGIGLLAVRSGAPILPARICGTDRLLDSMLRKTRFRVTFGRTIPPSEVEVCSRSEGYAGVARLVMKRISDLGDEPGREARIAEREPN